MPFLPSRPLLASSIAWWFVGTLLVSSAFAQGAASQDPDEPPAEYSRLVEEGLAESASSHWAEARALFRRAHAIFPNARTLRVIGMTSYELRDYVEADRMLRASLVDPRRPLTASQRSDVEGLLERTAELVGRYSLAAFPADARLQVDGVVVSLAPGDELVLATGEHTVDVRWGEERALGHWTVQGGEHEPLPARPIERVTTSDDSDVLVGPSESPVRRIRRVSGFAGIGLGAAVAGLGTFFAVRGHSELGRVDDATAGSPWSAVERDFERGPRNLRIGYSLVGGGVALAAAATILVVTVPEARPSLTVRVAPTSIALGARF